MLCTGGEGGFGLGVPVAAKPGQHRVVGLPAVENLPGEGLGNDRLVWLGIQADHVAALGLGVPLEAQMGKVRLLQVENVFRQA